MGAASRSAHVGKMGEGHTPPHLGFADKHSSIWDTISWEEPRIKVHTLCIVDAL